jgi:hypothetical protein
VPSRTWPSPTRRQIDVTLAHLDVSHQVLAMGAGEREEADVPEYVQVWRAKVADENVPELLRIRDAAIAEARALCPELIGADLVRTEDGSWLDVLRWSVPDGEERLMQHAGAFDAVLRMHSLLDEATQVGRGEVVASAAR